MMRRGWSGYITEQSENLVLVVAQDVPGTLLEREMRMRDGLDLDVCLDSRCNSKPGKAIIDIPST